MSPSKPPGTRAGKKELDLLAELTEAVAVSGDEGAVRVIVRREVEPHADEFRIDALGNVLAVRKGSGRGRMRVMLAAHMDEVGLMITAIDGEGFLRFDRVGHIDERDLLGKAVWIGAGRTPGVVGAKPVHLTRSDERRRTVEVESLRIDIGAGSKEAAGRQVKIGDRAAFASPFTRLGPTVRAKALDDRLGVAALIELVQDPPDGVDVLAAFTVQEEVGLRGARVAAFALEPVAALALDCTPARDVPTWEGEENTEYNARLGAGPAVYVADGATIADPRLVRLLLETAEEEGIPCQIRQPGGGGTDAGAIHLAREGIPSASVSVPGRHLHTAHGIASLEDWRNTVRLVHAALSRLRPALLKARPEA